MEISKRIKPLSVNECWQGKRFKTKVYKAYEAELLYTLPNKVFPDPPYETIFEFGFSSPLADWDNPVKPLQDVLQKKYGFDDKDIFKATVEKFLVPKKKEYFKVKINTMTINREKRRIVCAANKHQSLKITLLGARHWDDFMREQLDALKHAHDGSYSDLRGGEFIQGFIDNKGNFLTREEALEVAKSANQIIEKTCPEDQLFSEDLY